MRLKVDRELWDQSSDPRAGGRSDRRTPTSSPFVDTACHDRTSVRTGPGLVDLGGKMADEHRSRWDRALAVIAIVISLAALSLTAAQYTDTKPKVTPLDISISALCPKSTFTLNVRNSGGGDTDLESVHVVLFDPQGASVVASLEANHSALPARQTRSFPIHVYGCLGPSSQPGAPQIVSMLNGEPCMLALIDVMAGDGEDWDGYRVVPAQAVPGCNASEVATMAARVIHSKTIDSCVEAVPPIADAIEPLWQDWLDSVFKCQSLAIRTQTNLEG